MWQEVAKLGDIVPGGMKYVRPDDCADRLCRYGDEGYAVSRRCGHQNAPLDQGALNGGMMCPLHARFSVLHPHRHEPELADRSRHGFGGGDPGAP